MHLSSIDLNQIAVRLSRQNIPKALTFLKNVWEEMRPNYPFSYYFIDENFDQQYKAEADLQRIFSYFAFLSIFIGCLGLFGLAAYSAECRTKEIGIRKVLGASAGGVVVLLSKEFTKWVLLANIFAWPAAYIILSQWLQNFAYRSGLHFETFLLAGLLSWLTAFLTVSYQAVRASLADPVSALKYE
jgi:putative ABC transport system permease protein